jgi:formylglycine-generating enzyme required for sulfatase activity
MICPRCQEVLKDGARFCSNCGLAFSSLNATTEPAELGELPQASAKLDTLVGQVLDGKYELLARLGEGGMGTVYRARRLMIGDEVAVKVLLRKFVADSGLVERFRREARAAAALRHPNVVVIYDYGEARSEDAPAYIVMELVEGESLRQLLRREGRLKPERAVTLMRDICAGVGAAHRKQIFHRDLKPDNVIVLSPDEDRERETVKVVDFGIAKLRNVEGEPTLTETGALIGTPYYMSPEQINGEKLDARSDVYSLGVMLYEMLAGKRPFTAPNLAGVLTKHITEAPPPLPSDAFVLPALTAVIMRSLAKDPEARPADATELSRELRAAEEEIDSWREAEAQRRGQAEEKERLEREAEEAARRGREMEEPLQLDEWEVLPIVEQQACPSNVEPEPLAIAITPATSPPTVSTEEATVVKAHAPNDPPPNEKTPDVAARLSPQQGVPPTKGFGSSLWGLFKLFIFVSILYFGRGWWLPVFNNYVLPRLKNIVKSDSANNSPRQVNLQANQPFGNFTHDGQSQSGQQASETSGDMAQSFTEDIDGVKLEMVLIPMGTFTMGSPDKVGAPEYPPHQVTVQSFYVGKSLVTRALYKAVMGRVPYSSSNKDDDPVTNVSWDDANSFCQKLTQKLAQTTGHKYRLPSEAEWEYASVPADGFGQQYSIWEQKFVRRGKGYRIIYPTHHQMTYPISNVSSLTYSVAYSEWCADRYHDNYNGAPEDGSVWESGNSIDRVVRQGPGTLPLPFQLHNRKHVWITGDDELGFRVVALAPPSFPRIRLPSLDIKPMR